MIDLGPAIRIALVEDVEISGLLSEWNNEAAVFTRRPVPTDAEYPFIVISTDIAVTDNDTLNTMHQQVLRDIAVYGEQPSHFRVVEQIGYLIRTLFHRRKLSLGSVDGHAVIEIIATGPISAPTSDETIVGRVVTIAISLQEVPS